MTALDRNMKARKILRLYTISYSAYSRHPKVSYDGNSYVFWWRVRLHESKEYSFCGSYCTGMLTAFAVKKLELELELVQFLSDHCIEICLINETHLVPGKDFQMANYVSHRKNRPINGGRTMILVLHGIVNYSVPVSNLRHLEAIVICVKVSSTLWSWQKTVYKVLCFYFQENPVIIIWESRRFSNCSNTKLALCAKSQFHIV